MAKDNTEHPKDLKILHLFWTIMVAAVLVGVGWGVMRNEQCNQGEQIEKKVEKEVFEIYLKGQKEQTDTLVKSIDRGFDKIDSRLEKIESK